MATVSREHQVAGLRAQLEQASRERDLLLKTTEMYELDKRELQDEVSFFGFVVLLCCFLFFVFCFVCLFVCIVVVVCLFVYFLFTVLFICCLCLLEEEKIGGCLRFL